MGFIFFNYNKESVNRAASSNKEIKELRRFGNERMDFVPPVMIQSLLPTDSESFENALLLFLSDKFVSKTLMRVLSDYHFFGSSCHVDFLQIDFNGRIRAVKEVDMNPHSGETTGTRYRQNTLWSVYWAKKFHAGMSTSRTAKNDIGDFHRFRMVQCLFGEHLLNVERHPKNRNKSVGLVDDERDAVICSCAFPEMVWLAVGEKENAEDAEIMSVLKGRKVTSFPKRGEFYRWKSIADELAGKGVSINVSDVLERNISEERQKSLSIADYILAQKSRNPDAELVLEAMERKNPNIKILVDGLNLTPVSATVDRPA
ncbi:MAG: DUF6371 domain-containing protein [Prevotella sp.]|jgi:hypothetical protein